MQCGETLEHYLNGVLDISTHFQKSSDNYVHLIVSVIGSSSGFSSTVTHFSLRLHLRCHRQPSWLHIASSLTALYSFPLYPRFSLAPVWFLSSITQHAQRIYIQARKEVKSKARNRGLVRLSLRWRQGLTPTGVYLAQEDIIRIALEHGVYMGTVSYLRMLHSLAKSSRLESHLPDHHPRLSTVLVTRPKRVQSL